jgi:hypothetical protein
LRVQKVLVSVNKAVFVPVSMSSSVPHEIAVREEAVPVPSPHKDSCTRGTGIWP